MTLRPRTSLLLVLLGLPLALSLTACNKVEAVSIIPGAGIEVLTAAGQTAQYTAYATEQMGSGPTTTANVTTSVTWSSSNPNIATINSSGLATAVGAGYVEITAVASDGALAASDLTVNIPGTTTGSTGNTIASISIIPGSQSVSSPSQTSQFLAIGTTSSGATVNLTSQVAWSSSSAQIATVNSSGLATAIGQGTTTITTLYANVVGGTVVTGTATFTVAGGTTEQYTAVTILPGSQALSASGQTGQFIALATTGSTGLKTDVTSSSQITWSSSIPTIATVSASGLAEGVSAGSTTITAELTNPDGSVVSGTATVAISLTAAPEPLLSLTIIPNSVTAGAIGDTAQFLAIGTYATAPYVRDLTNSSDLAWISTEPNYFPVNSNTGGNSGASAGIVTAMTNGSTVIIAEATNPVDKTIQTATATFSCPLILPNLTGNPPTPGSCNQAQNQLFSTLTVYNEGLNTSNWVITASSATGTADVIHCGPGWPLANGGSVCSATYPLGTIVTLTAPAQSGVSFGGWSTNCLAQGTVSSTGPNTCTVTLTTNDTVGAIFN
jgi:uncharacterized protein YjdB